MYRSGEQVQAVVHRGGKSAKLGRFDSADEAALQVAREDAEDEPVYRSAAAPVPLQSTRRRERAATSATAASTSTAELSTLRTSAAEGGSGSGPPSTRHCPPSQSRTHAAVDDRPQQPAASRGDLAPRGRRPGSQLDRGEDDLLVRALVE